MNINGALVQEYCASNGAYIHVYYRDRSNDRVAEIGAHH